MDDWDSLLNLQEFWPWQDITIKTSLYREEKRLLSQEVLIHEVATLSRQGKTNAIELRLRCDWERHTGFATVTHLRVLPEPIRNPLIMEQLRLLLNGGGQKSHAMRQRTSTRTTTTREDDDSYPWFVFALTLLGDSGIVLPHASHEQQQHHGGCCWCCFRQFVTSILARRYGMDRREQMRLTATSDLEREDRAYQQAQREGEQILQQTMIHICDFITLRCGGVTPPPPPKTDKVAAVKENDHNDAVEEDVILRPQSSERTTQPNNRMAAAAEDEEGFCGYCSCDGEQS